MAYQIRVKSVRLRSIVVLFGCLALPSFLVLIFLTYSVGASAQAAEQQASNFLPHNSTQKTFNIEFYYLGEYSHHASIAADNFADLLSQETGLDIHASIKTCEAKIVENLGAGTADLAPLNINAYVFGQDAHGIEAKLVNGYYGAYNTRGQLNIQASSGYTEVWDLQGKRFASSDPNSVSGYMLPYLLISNTTGMTPTEFFGEVNFVGDHSQVIKDVYNGAADCGGTYDDAKGSVTGENPDVLDVVSVLSYTEYLPNSPWAFRKELDGMVVQTLADGIIAVFGTPDGEKALKAILGSAFSGIESIEDSAYDPSRDLVSTFGLNMEECHDIYLPLVSEKTGQ